MVGFCFLIDQSCLPLLFQRFLHGSRLYCTVVAEFFRFFFFISIVPAFMPVISLWLAVNFLGFLFQIFFHGFTGCLFYPFDWLRYLPHLLFFFFFFSKKNSFFRVFGGLMRCLNSSFSISWFYSSGFGVTIDFSRFSILGWFSNDFWRWVLVVALFDLNCSFIVSP